MFFKILMLIITILTYTLNSDHYTLKKIYYINMPSALKRKKGILKQINKIKKHFSNINVERIEPVLCDDTISWFTNAQNFGINPKKLHKDKRWFTNISDITSMTKMGCQTISIYLSHLTALRNIQAEYTNNSNPDRTPIYIVLEDDTFIGHGFLEFLDQLIANKANEPQPWFLMKPVRGRYNKTHLVNGYYYNMSLAKKSDWSYYFGAHCLIYNAKFVSCISEKLNNHGIGDIDTLMAKHIDHLYAIGQESKQFVTAWNKYERGVHSISTSHDTKPYDNGSIRNIVTNTTLNYSAKSVQINLSQKTRLSLENDDWIRALLLSDELLLVLSIIVMLAFLVKRNRW